METDLDPKRVYSKPSLVSAHAIGADSLLPPTNGQYRQTVQSFNAFLRETGLALNPESVQRFFIEHGANWSASTFNFKRAALIAGIRHTFRREPFFYDIVLLWDVVFREQLKAVYIKKHIQAGLSEAQYSKLIIEAPRSLSLFIEFLKESAMRISEALSTRMSRSRLEGKFRYFIITGKGNRVRIVFVSEDLVQRILRAFGHPDILFTNKQTGKSYTARNMRALIARHSLRIIGCALHPHCLRHFRAQELLRNGHSLKKISNFLGHSDASRTAQMYLNEEFTPHEIYPAVMRDQNLRPAMSITHRPKPIQRSHFLFDSGLEHLAQRSGSKGGSI